MVAKPVRRLVAVLSLLVSLAAGTASAQGVAAIHGTVTRSSDKSPLAGVNVSVAGLPGASTTTNANGKYTLVLIPTGSHKIGFRWLGYAPVDRDVTVTDGMTLDISMDAKAVELAELTVSTASREPERIVEAPAAVTSVEPRVLQNNSSTGQAPLALAQAVGVDLAQSGVNDFNINARGFNSSLNRRVLTLLDGRDLSIAFLGSQEWSTLPVATDELRSMELVSGPGSALYGANAFAGVIDMRTLSPREWQGGKFSVAGGELSSFRADGRWAGLFGNGRWGLRLNGAYSSNDTWTRSRTSVDSLDLRREYAPALGADSMTTPKTGFEAIALNGQTLGAGRTAIGDRKAIKNIYGTARLDHYMKSAVITAEGGASQSQNEVLVTGIGRIQVIKGLKPYARLAVNTDHFSVLGYMNRRESTDPQKSLGSGVDLIEKSTIMHVEAQANTNLMDRKARLVGGASFRQYNVNTEGTLMLSANDDRHDKTYSAYGQAEYKLGDKVRLVGAARYDKGDLYEGQFSPKGAIVYSPNANHAFRLTYNAAFQTPNYSEFYLRVVAAAPVNLALLEAGLRANPQLGPALAGVPNGTLFTTSSAVPVFARGNAALDVEKTHSWEVGYKGALDAKTFVTVDGYISNIKNFVTDLLPGVNPAFPYWTPPAAVPAQAQAALVGAVKSLTTGTPASTGLTRTEDGNTAVVLSYTNAGNVDQKGIDIGIGRQLTGEIRVNASFSWFDFKVKDQLAGDKLLPNTPKTKGTLSASYEGKRNGLDASVSARFVAKYDWAAGVLAGTVPASQTINATAGYQISPRYRVFVNGTNVLDQKRYQLYGGSVLGRRVMGGVTAQF